MQTWVVIASGHSLKDSDVAEVHAAKLDGRVSGVVAVSNVGLDKAAWADALVSHDEKWWRVNKAAYSFNGRRFCRHHLPNTERFIPKLTSGCNSGLMAMEVAHKVFGAERILLLGFDMHGTHYFGKHPPTLRNTEKQRFQVHIKQFNNWNGCEVINCTQGSMLTKFPFKSLCDVL